MEVSIGTTVVPIIFEGPEDYISYSHDGRADDIRYLHDGR